MLQPVVVAVVGVMGRVVKEGVAGPSQSAEQIWDVTSVTTSSLREMSVLFLLLFLRIYLVSLCIARDVVGGGSSRRQNDHSSFSICTLYQPLE